MQTFSTLSLPVRTVAVGMILTATSYAFAYLMGWTTVSSTNWLEVLAVATSYSCTYLCVMQSRWNYPLGVITTLLYAYLFWSWGLIGSALTNIYLPFALLYGWFRWGDDKSTRPVTKTTFQQWNLYTAITGISFGIVVLVLLSVNATLPLMDVGILVLTILAQWMLDNKKQETWYVWAAVNILAIIVYFQTGLYLAALQYVFFLGNTVYGWYMWKKSMNPSTGDHEIIWEDGMKPRGEI